MLDAPIIDAWDPEKVKIIPTFHPSWISCDDFIARVKSLKKRGFKCDVLYLAYPPQIKLSKTYKERFSKENINFSMQPFSGIYNGINYPDGYTAEEKAVMDCDGAECKTFLSLLMPSNLSKDYLYAEDCDITIQADGAVVYRSDSGAEEAIGNFLDAGIRLPENTALNRFKAKAMDRAMPIIIKEERVPEIIAQIPKYPRTYPPYRVFWTWDMLYSCNYTCAYCNIIRGRVNCSTEQTRHRIVELAVFKDIWDRIYDLYDSCAIRLTGGEPSIYPDFIKLVSFLTEKHVVNINTNLSFDIYKFMEKLSHQNICLNVSFHPEFITIENLMVKLRVLLKNGYGCSVCCVGYPPFLKDMERYKEILAHDNIPFNISPFMGAYEGRNFPNDYNEDERSILRRIANDPENKDDVNKKWLDFRMNEEKGKDKICRMGQTYAIILPNGDVKRCCSPFTKKIGSIFEKDFKIFDEAMLCDVDGKWNCPCFKAMLAGKEDSWTSLWVANEHSGRKKKKGVQQVSHEG